MPSPNVPRGNGTQTIAWRINEDAYRQDLEETAAVEAGQPPKPAPLRFYYGSIHDILSYPCEVCPNQIV